MELLVSWLADMCEVTVCGTFRRLFGFKLALLNQEMGRFVRYYDKTMSQF